MDNFLAGIVILLSLIDSGLTLCIINTGGIELNPVMGGLLELGDMFFISIKALMISLSVFILYKYRNIKFLNLFETRRFLHIAGFIYSTLVIYEVVLLTGI